RIAPSTTNQEPSGVIEAWSETRALTVQAPPSPLTQYIFTESPSRKPSRSHPAGTAQETGSSLPSMSTLTCPESSESIVPTAVRSSPGGGGASLCLIETSTKRPSPYLQVT